MKIRVILVLIMLPVLIAACSSGVQTAAKEEPTPTSVSPSQPAGEIDLDVNLPDGNLEKGLIAAIKYRCFGCHVENEDGLKFIAMGNLPVIKERGEIRIADPAYKGISTDNQEYILESILYPDAYQVAGDWDEEMPIYLADIMTEQELADILAWINTLE